MATFGTAGVGPTGVPDLSGALNILSKSFGTPESREADRVEQERLEREQRQIDILTGEAPSVDGDTRKRSTTKQKQAALVRLSALNPQAANAIRQSLERGDKLALADTARKTEEGTRQALFIQRQPDFAGKQRALASAAQEASARGEDVSRFVELSNLSEPQLDLELEKMIVQGADLKTLTKEFLEAEEVATPGGEIVKSSEIVDGFIVRRQPDGTFTKTKVLEVASTTEKKGLASAVTKIFNNGTVIQALPSGGVVVKDPAGNIVEGDARLKALKDARDADIQFGALGAATTKAASAAIAQSTKAFERLEKVDTSINNIDQAISALDRGAKTGAIQSKLPSIRAASVELDNIQKAMGLDVIGNVTFGALSKGELDLALSKAIPTGLDEPELRDWLVKKRASQQKLQVYIKDAAIFLGTPGNTIAGWIEAQDAISEGAEEAKATGEVVEVDF